jgi:inner membrane protein
VASIGHVIVGCFGAAVAKRYRPPTGFAHPWTSMIVMSGLSLLPDADVIGFPLGVAYESPFGHRGATHSIVFALLVAVGCALIARVRRERWRIVFVLVLSVVLSHGLLDMLTDGGLGVALFFPSNHRWFFPWNPIPVAPIGRGFFTPRGLAIALTETAYFSPLIALTIGLCYRDRRRTASVS